MSHEQIEGFDYGAAAKVFKTRAQWQQLERNGYKRQVDAARGETWYRDDAGALVFEAYANIPAAPKRTAS